MEYLVGVSYKKLFLVFLIVFSGNHLFAQNNSRKKAPQETVEIGENTYMGIAEVTIGQWMVYYIWLLDFKSQAEADEVLPDSTLIEPEIWKYFSEKRRFYIRTFAYRQEQERPGPDEFEYFWMYDHFDKNFKPSKHKSQEFLLLPITGISYEQAVTYCKWRTMLFGRGEKIYRLPTIAEWQTVTISTLKEHEVKNRMKDSSNKDNTPSFNYKHKYPFKLNYCQTKIAPAVRFWDGEKKLVYDLLGNVSEMTEKKNIAVGGNYTTFANQSHLDSVQLYSKPEPWLGFRFVVKEKEKEKETMFSHYDTIPKKLNELFDERDGKRYKMVEIGSQIWMAENLAYKPDSGNYWAYMNDERYVGQYGYLYDWNTALIACPVGWHLPTKEEFDLLISDVGEKGQMSNKNLLISGYNGFTFKSSPFKAGMNFIPPQGSTLLWTSTSSTNKIAWVLEVLNSHNTINLVNIYYQKKWGLPIRCIKNK